MRHHNIRMPLSRKRRLSLVREADAAGRTLEIYQEIKRTLGIPHVNAIFQAYGAYPRFLDLMWKLLRPAVDTQDFFQRADRLRAEAYTRIHNYFAVPDLCSTIRQTQFSVGAQHELTNVVDLFLYNDPLLLLIAAVQLQAFEDGPTHVRAVKTGADHPAFTEKLVMLTEEAAPVRIRKIYDDIKRTVGVSFINSDFQALARWPDFLTFYWNALKPVVSSPLYSEHKHALRESAVGLANELPNAPQLSVERMKNGGLTDEEITTAIYITEEFLELCSRSALNVAFAKISLDGGNQNHIPTPKEKQKHQIPQDQDNPEQAA